MMQHNPSGPFDGPVCDNPECLCRKFERAEYLELLKAMSRREFWRWPEVTMFLAGALVLFLTASEGLSAADSREAYASCVTEQLDQGAALATIGDACLERATADAEPYPYEQSLREVLADEGSLFDPESALFKDLVYADRFNGAWCGQLNAKNRLGGYVGWRYFAVREIYRGRGSATDVDLTLGGREVEATCKNYQAWEREHWE